jgi:hypothetical protein
VKKEPTIKQLISDESNIDNGQDFAILVVLREWSKRMIPPTVPKDVKYPPGLHGDKLQKHHASFPQEWWTLTSFEKIARVTRLNQDTVKEHVDAMVKSGLLKHYVWKKGDRVMGTFYKIALSHLFSYGKSKPD